MKDFLKGFALCAVVIPLIDGAITLYNQLIEYTATKVAVKTYALKKDLEEEEQKTDQGCAIGFSLPAEEEYYEDEDDEE